MRAIIFFFLFSISFISFGTICFFVDIVGRMNNLFRNTYFWPIWMEFQTGKTLCFHCGVYKFIYHPYIVYIYMLSLNLVYFKSCHNSTDFVILCELEMFRKLTIFSENGNSHWIQLNESHLHRIKISNQYILVENDLDRNAWILFFPLFVSCMNIEWKLFFLYWKSYDFCNCKIITTVNRIQRALFLPF